MIRIKIGKRSRKTANHISNCLVKQTKQPFRRHIYRKKNAKKAAGAALGHGCANSLKMVTVFSYSNFGDFDDEGCQDSAAVRLYQEDERIV